MSTNIQVAIRARPLIPSERVKDLRIQWGIQNNQIYQIDESGACADPFCFDHIFGMDKTNSDIYTEIVEDFVDSSMSGLNSTIFAYGQTSSGKTYTMLGNKNDRGIMALAIENIFNKIETSNDKKFLIRVSYLEIYNEKISDLLDPNNKDIRMRELLHGVFKLQNIKEEIVTTRKEMYDCLRIGIENRHVAATKVNDRSSRSHTIFKIMIESTKFSEEENGSIHSSVLNLVDLAGSERAAQTGATGIRLKEGSHINKSLSALGLVILQLSDGKDYVNFRDSKLTCLLKDSLGGNSKTLIIATVTLASLEDTNSTLAFAQRAKAVKNKPLVNEVLSNSDSSKRYATLNAQLKKKLEEQLKLNKLLERKQEANLGTMKELEHKIQCLENFQTGKSDDSIKRNPKRRHTIGFCSQKNLFDVRVEDLESDVFSSDDLPSFEDLIKQHGRRRIGCSMETITEEGTPCTSLLDIDTLDTFYEKEISPSKETPTSCLRSRVEHLERDYGELVTFTRDEDNLLELAYKNMEELAIQLENERTKFLQYQNDEERLKTREQELLKRIEELEQNAARTSELVDTGASFDIECIKEQLGNLQNILCSKKEKVFCKENTAIIDLQDDDQYKSHIDDILKQIQRLSLDSNDKEKATTDSQHHQFKTEIEEFQKQIYNLNLEIVDNNKLITELQNDDNVKTKIDEFQKQIDNLNLEMIHKNRVITELQNHDQNKAQIDEFQKQIDKLKLEIVDKNKLITELKSDDKFKTQIDEFQKQIDKLNLEIVDRNKFITELQNDDKFKTQIDEFQKQIEKLNLEIVDKDKLITELQNDDQNKAQIDDLHKQIDNLNLEIVDKDKLIIELQNDDNYKAQIIEFHTQIDKLNLEIVDKDRLITELQNDDKFKTQFDEFQTQINKLNLQIVDKDKLINELQNDDQNKAQKDEFQKQIDILNLEIVDKDKLITELQIDNQCKKENGEFQMQIDNLNLEIVDKNKTITDLQNKGDQFKAQIVDFRDQVEKLNLQISEKDTITQALTLKVAEKDQTILTMQNKSLQLEQQAQQMQEIRTLVASSYESNDDLLQVLQKLIYNTEARAKGGITTLNDNLVCEQNAEAERLKTELENTQENIEMLEQRCTELQEKVKTLNEERLDFCVQKTVLELENEKMVSVIEDLKKKEEQLKLEQERNDVIGCELKESLKLIDELKEQLANLSKANGDITEMKEDIASKKNEQLEQLKSELQGTQETIAILQQNCTELQEQVKTLNQERLDYRFQKTALELEKEKMVCVINGFKKNEEQLKVAQSKEPERNDAISCDLKEALTKIHELKQQLVERGNDLRKCEAVNEKLLGEIKLLQEKIESNRSNEPIVDRVVQNTENEVVQDEVELKRKSDEIPQHTEASSKELNCLDEKSKNALCKIMEHLIHEVTLLADWVPKNRALLIDVKKLNSILKQELELLQKDDQLNVDKIVESLKSSYACFKSYFESNESELKSQIIELESIVENCQKEIADSRSKEENSKPINCECASLKIVIESKENELKLSKTSIADLKKEKSDLVGEVMSLQRKIANEYRQKKELQYEEWMKFHVQNEKIQREELKKQHKQIQKLVEKIEQYEQAMSKTDQRASAETQCNIFESNLGEKYEYVKTICFSKKAEVESLKSEIGKWIESDKLQREELKKQQREIEQYHEEMNKENKQTSVEVQCNVFESDLKIKYEHIKSICVSRKEDIELMKLEMGRLKNRVMEYERKNPLCETTNIANSDVKDKNQDLAELQDKYNKAKRVCQMRKEEIANLKAQLAASKGATFMNV